MNKLVQLIANYREHQLPNIYVQFAANDIPENESKELVKVLPKLYKLFDDGLLRKDLVFFNLLANPSHNFLSHLVNYEINQPLNLHDGISLFSHCYYRRKHWFAELLCSHKSLLLKCLETSLQNEIKIFELIKLTNQHVISIESVQNLLSYIETKNVSDEFIALYVKEIRYILSIIAFCKQQKSLCDLNNTQLFLTVNQNKLLKLFSELLSLDDAAIWNDILQKLKEEELRFECNLESDATSRDVDEFNCYLILANVIKSLKACIEFSCRSNERSDTISLHINNARESLEDLHPKLAIQILEDIFTMCFLKIKHFHINSNNGGDNSNGDEFVCADKEFRLLLYFLRSCIDDLKSKIPMRSTEANNLQELNRHVKEALWRLEMLDDLDSFDMSHMLSDAETLIQTSLKKGRFDKAHQVIQIFNLEETPLAQEIIYTEKLNDLRSVLQHGFKLQTLQKQMPNINSSSSSAHDKHPRRLIDDFLDKSRNETLHDLTDVAFIATLTHDDTKEVLDCIKFSHKFHDRATVLLDSIQNKNIQEILTIASYDLDLDAYRTKLQFNHELEHTLTTFNNYLNNTSHGGDNQLHLIYKTYSDLKQLAGIKEVNQTSYFHRVFNYLKIFLRVFNTEGNNLDLISRPGNFVSYFDVLQRCRSDWIGKLLFERKMDPRDFDHLFSKMKIDALYSTATNCFPQIGLGIKRHSFDREFQYQEPTKLIFSYIAKRNWLLAFIVNEIFNFEQMEVNASRTKYFTQYTKTDEIENIKSLFGNNNIVAALHENYYERCVNFINEHLFDEDASNAEQIPMVEPAEELSEGSLKSKWLNMLYLLDSIQESKFTQETYDLRDTILMNLVADTYDDESYKFVKYMKSDDLRRRVILENFMKWPGEFCISLLKMEVDLDLVKWADKVQFCEEIKHLFNSYLWSEVHDLCLISPGEVYEKLLTIPRAYLILNFDKYYDARNLLSNLPTDYMASLFNSSVDLKDIRELLLKLDNPIGMCLELVETVRNLNQLEFVIEHLIHENYSDENFLKNVRVSSKILRQFQPHEREQLWCLISNPLSLIEMLIMNTKLDKLGVILQDIHSDLENCEFSDNVVSLEGIDELLRKYAEKSLDVRIILQPHPSLLKGSDIKLMESLDSIYGPDRKYFEMPQNVPSKSEWIPNDQVLECMCCQNTVFSMFNRRHHCRRCGRVICFNCSTKRMQVPTYGDILVRVCIDCYDQSKADTKSDSTSNKSVVCDYWFLSDNSEHNAIVRQEFSYEHAPSVSLCLAIIKYHTKTDSYPKFLLDQCDVMLKLLQPPAQNAPQEVDYMLVIKMLKSLAIAAKMISSECQLPWGSSQADRILSQADLFALLAERGCLNLLPPSSSGAPYVDGIILRKLRDKLLMQEQWNFALDVSTKAGLENAGVFAAWGKSCLKAGCLQMAREKFQRCFEKPGHYDPLSSSMSISVDDDLIDGSSFRSKYSRPGLTDNKPLRNPVILEQIIEILESKTISFTQLAQSPARKPGGTDNTNAILIKAKLRSLKAIANGNLESRTDFKGCNIDPEYFRECIYYLKKYGSHFGLLQFYLKHNQITESLLYIFDTKVTVDIFIEVYIICLRDGKVNQLQKGMSRIDSTLEIWKDYLKGICRHLEKQGLLNSLYQLQQYMVDYVRAAMTCIRFYKDNATSYRELAANIHFLDKAEAHFLQELEQQQWVEVNAVVKNISDNSYEEKPALSNPSLVMKMDSRTIEQHIHTIKRQSQITKFLAHHEKNDQQLIRLLSHIMPQIDGENPSKVTPSKQLPTLFDSTNEKVQLAVLLIICGEKVQDGYDLAHSIIQDYKLKTLKVYCHAGRQLAREDRYNEIAELVNCIRSKGSNDPAVTSICDEMLTLAVRTLSRNDVPTSQLESLIKLITDRATKISIYIETRQLKSAYLLAAKYNRFGDIRRILREAELINKQDIKKLCQRLLQAHSHSKD